MTETTTQIPIVNHNSPVLLSEYNSSMMKFQEDILSSISQLEYRFTSKLSSLNKEYSQSQVSYDTTVESINAKFSQLSQSIAMIKVKYDHLKDYESFASKAKDEITNHDIRLNNLSKDLSNAFYKYDRIFIDNLLLPGFIGDCCKFRSTKEFFNDVIIQLAALNQFKEKQTNDLHSYKEKLESIIKNISKQSEVIMKVSLKNTEDAIKENNVHINNKVVELKHGIEELNMENNRNTIELKEKMRIFNCDAKDVAKMKEEIMTKFEAEIAQYKHDNRTTHTLLNEYQEDFKVIKKKFRHLATFIRDVRFRSNLRTLIKRDEISSLYRKMHAKNYTTLDIDAYEYKDHKVYDDSQIKYNYCNHHNIHNQYNSHNQSCGRKVKPKRKSMTQYPINENGLYQNRTDNDLNDTDKCEININMNARRVIKSTINDSNSIDNINSSNSKQHYNSTMVNIEAKKYQNHYPIKLQDYNQFDNYSCVDYQNSPIISTSKQNKNTSIVMENNLKRENHEIRLKLIKINKKLKKYEANTTHRLNKLANYISYLFDYNSNGNTVNNNNNQLSILVHNFSNNSMLNSQSNSSRNKCNRHKNNKTRDLSQIELRTNMLGKPCPISVVDLVQGNAVKPSIDQINKQNNLNTIKRHKELVSSKSRVRSGHSMQGKASMPTVINAEEDNKGNLHNFEPSNIVPHIYQRHNKTSMANNPTVNESKLAKKGDKTNYYSIIDSYQWVPLKKLNRLSNEVKGNKSHKCK